MRRSDGEPSACRSIAAWDMTVLPFATQIKNGCATIKRDCALEVEVTLCVRGVVTVAVSNMTFLEPVRIGDAICCYTDTIAIGETSITLAVEVWVLRQGQGDRVKVTDAEFKFVALNNNGCPRPVLA
jgi:acyl-CoA hydrolase